MIRQILTSIDQLQILQNIKINLTKNHCFKIYDDKAIISCKNYPVERRRKIWLKSVQRQGNWALVVKTDV